MNPRTSIVPTIFINSIAFSSIFEIGDANRVDANSQAIAVQREYPLFVEDEADFASYQIFSEIIPLPTSYGKVTSTFIHENPIIKVQSLNITGVSNASIVQVGSSKTVNAEARVKHIRQLLDEK